MLQSLGTFALMSGNVVDVNGETNYYPILNFPNYNSQQSKENVFNIWNSSGGAAVGISITMSLPVKVIGAIIYGPSNDPNTYVEAFVTEAGFVADGTSSDNALYAARTIIGQADVRPTHLMFEAATDAYGYQITYGS